jgi:hypothetical protein
MQQSGELVLITGDSPCRAKQADPLLFQRRLACGNELFCIGCDFGIR